MKKHYTLTLLLSLFTAALSAQTLVVSTGFDNYAGSVATVPAGWYIDWNSSSSYYASTGNYGLAAPSYKFGNDSDFVVAPAGFPGMDSISFFTKGNGSPFSPLNEFRIYQSTDSMNWVLVHAIDSLPTTGTTYTLPLNGNPYISFVYRKQPAGGNIAFDDVNIYSLVTGVPSVSEKKAIKVYPVPSNSNIFIEGVEGRSTQFALFDMIGNLIVLPDVKRDGKGVFSTDLSSLKRGIYFLKITDGNKTITKKITLIN